MRVEERKSANFLSGGEIYWFSTRQRHFSHSVSAAYWFSVGPLPSLLVAPPQLDEKVNPPNTPVKRRSEGQLSRRHHCQPIQLEVIVQFSISNQVQSQKDTRGWIFSAGSMHLTYL